MKKECVLLDVFTDSPFSGNQLAVFPDAEDLSLDQMQRLANEINYSETTFSKIHTGFFAPHLGIIEDPAPGSAAGPLTGYLLKYGIFGNEFEIQNEQGIEINRPSRILMRGKVKGGCYRVEIGGTCCYMGHSTSIL